MENEPKPCAAVKGTQVMVSLHEVLLSSLLNTVGYQDMFVIFTSQQHNSLQVENLFYNMVARRKSLQNSNDDYPKIVDFISRFAVHHINVNFFCRKVNIPAFFPLLYHH